MRRRRRPPASPVAAFLNFHPTYVRSFFDQTKTGGMSGNRNSICTRLTKTRGQAAWFNLTWVRLAYFFRLVPYFLSTMQRPKPRSRLARFITMASSMSYLPKMAGMHCRVDQLKAWLALSTQ